MIKIFFDSDTKLAILCLTLYGYLMPIIVFIIYIEDKFKNRTHKNKAHKKRITKFLYRVANIGVPKSKRDALNDNKINQEYSNILYDGENFL